MKVEMQDEKTLVVTPESTAEMIVLKNMIGAKVTLDKPMPFHNNVDTLKISKE